MTVGEGMGLGLDMSATAPSAGPPGHLLSLLLPTLHCGTPSSCLFACLLPAGYYHHPDLQQWGLIDPVTSQFTPHDATAAAHALETAAAPGMSTAAEGALAATNAALASSRLQQQYGGSGGAGPGAHGQPGQQQKKQPRRGAVIGASPKLDSHGLLEAARAAEERAILLKKRQDMEEERQKAAAARAGAAAGTAEGAVAAGAGQGAAPQQAVQGGVVYRGKWAARRQEQEQQRQ